MKNTKNNLWAEHSRRLYAIAIILVIGFTAAACIFETSTPHDHGNPSELTGTVSISGTAQVGQTLTAVTISLGGTGTISYQWKRGSANIGANSRTYQVQTADVGLTIKVTVTRAGCTGSVTSKPTAAVIGPDSPPPPPQINTAVLQAKIAEAESMKSLTEVNTTAENVSQGAYWVTQDVMTAFENAISAARSALSSAASQEALDSAANTLQSAITTFSGVRQEGVKTLGFTSAQVTALVNSTKADKEGVHTSTNGDDVSPVEYWVSSSVLGTFNAAISALESANGQPAIDAAYLDLVQARETFNSAKQHGTTPDRTALNNAITAAGAAKDGVQTAASSEQVPLGSSWATAAQFAALNTAIENAAAVKNDANTTKAAVDAEAANLNDAINAFTAAVTSNGPGTNESGGSQTFRDITAEQLAADIKIGWNLGNSLDAHNGFPANPTVDQMERGWGNPATTKANITAIKNAGFNAIRIPVSWTKAASGAPNYTIRADWMARVKEIVNYAVDNDMYIILNTHHDEDALTFMNSNAAAGKAAFKKLWEQIADAFKDYNEKLIFEGLNEPRTPGSSSEWNGGTAEERANLNSYYPIFVNTVRNSGGNNDKRVLMINPYAASMEAVAMNALELPADSAANKLIVSFHSYQPYSFALDANSPTNTWNSGSSGDTSPITGPIDRYYTKFVSKGIPVIIGEFGAMNKNNEAVRAQWAEFYISYARSKGIKCFWWDNGVTSGSGELFGLLNRQNNTFTYPVLLNGMMSGTGGDVPTPPTPPTPPETPTLPTTITGNLGTYQFGTQEDGVTPNYTQAVWVLSGTNLTTAKTAGAKLVLGLSSAPTATMQFVWQGPDNGLWWNEKEILGNTGNPSATGVTWDLGTKTLTIPLTANSVKDYSVFTTQPSLRIIIAYYGGENVNDLGIVSANLTQ
ncbi:MAG: glycoside hydrolase family 5 protein [Treponema sp.]|jgi:endoglucanase|nr:glycoside hydrolase family 5 protein [Treponema sp.]